MGFVDSAFRIGLFVSWGGGIGLCWVCLWLFYCVGDLIGVMFSNFGVSDCVRLQVALVCCGG